ncbi:MAG: hypothetical protein DWQ02_11360 [Bacteroidetes bacterium]|nr:MAG: hypothetical protein DWQ02_11360 [Bacteroidota bacterium]
MKASITVMTVAVMVFLCSTTAIAQNKKSNSGKLEFAERLWYGGGFGLGLSSSTFGLEVSPMVGYKITEKFSVGPRIPLSYTYAKLVSAEGTGLNYNNLDLGIGAFTRYKIFNRIFAHMEYNYLWVSEPVTSNGYYLLDPDNSSSLLKENSTKDEFNLGLGYAGGGRLGTEISLLYNVLNDPNSLTIPLTIRVGFNYKF